MGRKSYKFQIALTSCIISGIVLLSFMAGVTQNVKYEFAELVDHDMEAIATSIMAGAKSGDFDSDPLTSIASLDEGSYRGANYCDEEDLVEPEKNVKLLAVKRPNGEFAYRNPLYWNDSYTEKLDRTPFLEIGTFLSEEELAASKQAPHGDYDARWEVRIYRKDGYIVYLAINQHENKDEYIELIYLSALALPVAFVFVALGGWLMGVYAVRPIKAISSKVSSIRPDRLASRVPGAERQDEVGELARFVNDMLERVEKGYEQAKRFTADASHELRTPLAILQGELEAKMRETDADSETYARMLEEIRRLKTLTHSLLFLSKADSGTLELEKQRIDLGKLAKQVMADLSDLYQETKLTFELDDRLDGAYVSGDRSLILQTLMNLVRNAATFNRPGGRVLCSLSKNGHFVRAVVGNTGPSIPAESKDRIFERFYRNGTERNSASTGFGLGLNIARETARVHGGDIVLLQSEDDWTEFELSFPID